MKPTIVSALRVRGGGLRPNRPNHRHRCRRRRHTNPGCKRDGEPVVERQAGCVRPRQASRFMPVPAKDISGSKGEFEVSGLLAGKYRICVEKREAAILNPCLWADSPLIVDVGEGAAVRGVSAMAARGVTISVRVQDAKGLLRANPAKDDVRVGTFHRASPFIPGIVSDRDPAGKTMSVIVPRGQAASVSVSSASFDLADAGGAPLASPEIAISAAAANAGAAPAVTIHVTDVKPGQP